MLEQWVLRTAAPHLKFVPWLTDTTVFSAWRNNETLAITWPIRMRVHTHRAAEYRVVDYCTPARINSVKHN